MTKYSSPDIIENPQMTGIQRDYQWAKESFPRQKLFHELSTWALEIMLIVLSYKP